MINIHQSSGSYNLRKWNEMFCFQSCSNKNLTRSNEGQRKKISRSLSRLALQFICVCDKRSKGSLPNCKFIFATYFSFWVLFYFDLCFQLQTRQSTLENIVIKVNITLVCKGPIVSSYVTVSGLVHHYFIVPFVALQCYTFIFNTNHIL